MKSKHTPKPEKIAEPDDVDRDEEQLILSATCGALALFLVVTFTAAIISAVYLVW